MANYVQYQLSDGTVVEVEATGNVEVDPDVRASPAGDILVRTGKTFAEAMKKIKSLAADIRHEFSDLANVDTEVTFALKTSGDLDFKVGKLGAESSFTVKLKWSGTGANESGNR